MKMICSCSIESDLESIRLMNVAFQRFPSASGLHANVDKSAIYMAGISDSTRQEIVETWGFTIDSLPFRYLAIP